MKKRTFLKNALLVGALLVSSPKTTMGQDSSNMNYINNTKTLQTQLDSNFQVPKNTDYMISDTEKFLEYAKKNKVEKKETNTENNTLRKFGDLLFKSGQEMFDVHKLRKSNGQVEKKMMFVNYNINANNVFNSAILRGYDSVHPFKYSCGSLYKLNFMQPASMFSDTRKRMKYTIGLCEDALKDTSYHWNVKEKKVLNKSINVLEMILENTK